MKNYKALFFDFDDTLFDFGKTEAVAITGTFAHYRIEPSAENIALYKAQNQAFWRAYEKGIYKNESDSVVRFKNLTEAIGREDIDYREMCAFFIDLLCTTAFPIDNSPALLQKLSERYAIYIVTNALKRVNDARCAIGGIQPYLSGKFISESIGFSKPNKGFFDACFAAVPYSKEQTLLVGDSLLSDMKGGVEYGLDTCWFNPHHLQNPDRLPVTYEIDSLQQLEELLL